jgi:VIT1/CCC1 family predicted Fe2+/Mn2+ transporter
LLAITGILHTDVAGWVSVTLALSTLFGAGVYMGRIGKTNPYKKGARMVIFGLLAFAIGFLLDWFI